MDCMDCMDCMGYGLWATMSLYGWCGEDEVIGGPIRLIIRLRNYLFAQASNEPKIINYQKVKR